MKEENIKRANTITNSLESLRQQVTRWNECVKFSSGSITGNTVGDYDRELFCSYINFDVCKALALVAIKKEINELEKELETL